LFKMFTMWKNLEFSEN